MRQIRLYQVSERKTAPDAQSYGNDGKSLHNNPFPKPFHKSPYQTYQDDSINYVVHRYKSVISLYFGTNAFIIDQPIR